MDPNMTSRVDIGSAWRTAIALAWLGASGGSGCEEFGPHVYTAQRYRPDLGCLETYAPLGLVEAKDLGASCAPVCLSRDEELFVSTICPPYPATVEASDSEACAAALAAPSCDDLEGEDPSDAGSADPDSADAASADL
jgi:hypothetical protein